MSSDAQESSIDEQIAPKWPVRQWSAADTGYQCIQCALDGTHCHRTNDAACTGCQLLPANEDGSPFPCLAPCLAHVDGFVKFQYEFLLLATDVVERTGMWAAVVRGPVDQCPDCRRTRRDGSSRASPGSVHRPGAVLDDIESVLRFDLYRDG